MSKCIKCNWYKAEYKSTDGKDNRAVCLRMRKPSKGSVDYHDANFDKCVFFEEIKCPTTN